MHDVQFSLDLRRKSSVFDPRQSRGRSSLAVAQNRQLGHPWGMNARTPEPGPPIPCAPFDGLDLEKPEDESEWDRRVMALAAARIATERVRLERLGIIGADGELISRALPPDMLPESDTTLETG